MKLPDFAVLNHKRSKASKIFLDFPFPRQPEVMLEFGRGTPTPVSPRAGFGVSFLMAHLWTPLGTYSAPATGCTSTVPAGGEPPEVVDTQPPPSQMIVIAVPSDPVDCLIA